MINTTLTHHLYRFLIWFSHITKVVLRFSAKCAVLWPSLLMFGCSSAQWNSLTEHATLIKPYRIEIAQGNVVTKEQMQTLQIGATADAARDQLGSPTLIDVFHPNRWDYHFSFARDGQPLQNRVVTLYFEEGKLTKFEAPDLPSEAEFSASITKFKPGAQASGTELTPVQRKALPAPPRKSSPAQNTPQGAIRTYPPLEATQ